MERIALGTAAALYVLSAALSAVALPARVPLHFAADGAADRYGSRQEALVGFVVLGLVLLLLWLVMVWTARRAGLELINVPHPEYWKAPEHEPELRRRIEVDLTWFLAAAVLLLATVPLSMAVAAEGTGRLPWALPVLLGLFLAGTGVWCWYLVTRRYRPPADARAPLPT